MYTLKVDFGGVIIISKTLTKDECESIGGFGTQWVCNAYKYYLNLDISDYTISECLTNQKDYFLVNIRQDDLVKLRSDKLNKIL